MAKQITWYLIADAAHARVLVSSANNGPLLVVPEFSLAASLPRSSAVGFDRPGRTHESVGSTRHALQPKSDPHRRMKRDFAKLIADKLDAAAAIHAFDRLVVAAPPTMLGDLRQEFSQHVTERVIAEVAKDLAKLPDHALMAHFADVSGL